MTMRSRWTETTGAAVAAAILLWAGTAWAGYTNWDVKVDEWKGERTNVPVDGPVRFTGTAVDVDYKPAYKDPPKSKWVKMTVTGPSGSTIPGSVRISIDSTKEVDKHTRRIEFDMRWDPKSSLGDETTYSFELEELREGHGMPHYKRPMTGTFSTGRTGGTADTGTTSGGTTDTGTEAESDTGVPGPDTGGDGGTGHSDDAGPAWSDAGDDASSGGTSGGASKGDGSANRRACSQTDGPVPLGTFGLTLALFAAAGFAHRRD